MASDGWLYGAGAALLAVGAAVLLLYRHLNALGPWYLALLVGGTASLSFVVGWVLGYLTESGMAPTSRHGE